MTSAVYVVLVEVRARAGCELVPADCHGAFVRCYVAAADGDAALARVTAALDGERCTIVTTEWCRRRDALPADLDDRDDGDAHEAAAAASDEVVIARIDAWNDDEDAPC